MNTLKLTTEMAVRGLFNNITRSILTILGIVIGIAAVIAVMAVGNGAQATVLDSINSLGSDIITISPPRGQGSALTQRDIEYLSAPTRFPHIQTIAPTISGSTVAAAYEANDAETYVSILGVSAEYFDLYPDIELEIGSLIDEEDVTENSKAIVIGTTVATELFGSVSPQIIGTAIKIDSQSYTIQGILAEQESSGFTDPNSNVYMAYTTVAEKFTDSDDLSSIIIGVDDSDNIETTELQIETYLTQFRGLEEADFSLLSAENILSTATEVTGVFTVMLTSIASISLVVGGIGISNIMLVSVTERIKEIGLRKAIGARQIDILLQFLLEAILLTTLGGIVGVIFGYIAAQVITALTETATLVSVESVILATSISVLIGLTFGFLPANRAAKLNPIDALRTE